MLKKLVVGIVSLIAFASMEAGAQSCTVCTGNLPILTASKVVYFPAWPNCPVTITYRYRECPPPVGVTEMWFYSLAYSVNPVPPECSGIENYLYPMGPTGRYPNYAAWDGLMIQSMDLITDALFLDWFADNPTSYCPTGTKSYSVNSASCRGYFTVDRPDLQMTELRIAECDSWACCTKEITICMDRATNQPVRVETIVSTGQAPDCSNETPNIPNGLNPIYISPCQFNCYNF